jgi:hypothetical protein
MFDTKHGDSPIFVIDFVDDSVGATSSRPKPREFTLQLMPDLARVLAQRSQ